MEIQALFLSLLILSIVSNTESRSLETSYKCATTCTEPENLTFRKGFTYQYIYTATVVSSFQDGSSADHSSEISIHANAMIDVLSHCEMVLRVTDASIQNSDYVLPDDARQWAENIQRHPLHFNFQDGKIPDICAANDDPTWVLNIKKGILSALQVSTLETVEAIQETDVSGACESSYTVEDSNGNLKIVKRKDYNKCEDRDKYLLFSHFTPYNSESPRQSFIISTQTCTQRVQRNQLSSSICDENHVFRPFSTSESGAQTTIRQSLQYNGRQRYYTQNTLGIANVRRTNLIFESENDAFVSTDISELQTLYSELCTTMSGENYKQVGKDFIKMVFLLRRLDSSAVEQAYSSVTGACPKWEAALKGMFQDALQWCGSEGCVVFATRLIASSEHIPNNVARRWMTGMSLIAKPTLPMLRGMMDVVQSGRLKEFSYLTAGTMIHRLCTKSSVNCLTEPVVRRALEVFEGQLGTNCRTSNPEQKQNILLSLRALGNAGRTTAINTLAACSEEENNDMETRIAAVQSFRRMPCNTDRSALRRIALDVQRDSEIRIASYLSVMKCPTPSFIQQIVILLEDEPTQQVSSFIWSHVNELLESNDPMKGYIKPMLLETEFAKKHDLDPRKYSRFYEASLFSEALNAGATVESSVVWSPKSFVPRSAELDLSVDVFGQAVSLLEIGGRVEGVEKMVQSALASDNFFKNNPLSELFMASDDDENDDDQTEAEDEPRRNSRETDNTRLAELRNEYQANLNSETSPNANWYLRVFGNEMYYQNTRSMQEKMAGVDINSIFTKLAMGGDYNYHDDTMLMNSAHVLPTGIGLPLTIAFNGSASVDVNVKGNLDIAGLFKYPRNLGIDGSLKPRAVVLVTGSMSVDAIVTKTGIATESSAVTSWTIGGRVSITNSQSVEVKIDAPYSRNTFFSFNHKLMKLNGEEEIDIGTEQESNNIDCSQEYAGQRLCVASPPNAAVFAMTGPITMSAYTEKRDDSLEYYRLKGTFSTQYNDAIYPSELETSITLDTPGSIVNRERNIRASYNIQQMQFGVNVQSPETSILLQGSVENEPLRKHAVLTYVKNGEQTRFEVRILQQVSAFTITSDARMGKVHDEGKIQWSASTVFETPTKNISATASAALDPASRISAQLQIENLLEEVVIINGSLEDASPANSNRLRYRGNSQITVPGYIDTGVQFDMDIKPQVDVFIFGLLYEFRGMRRQSIRLNHKRRDHSTPTTTDWEGEQKLTLTQYPKFNHHMLFSYTNGPGQVKSFIKVGLGRHSGHEDNNNFFLVNQTFTYNVAETTEVEANVNIEIPPFDISQVANLNHRYSSSLVDSNLRVGSYGIHFFVQDSTPANGLINKELNVEIPTPWGNLRVHDTIEETSPNVYALRGELGVGTSRGLTMNGRCNIENLADRKSITINIQDDLHTSLLTAQSVFQFLTPSGYSWENSMESTYNNLINLNLRHEGKQQGGFESSFLVEHQPDKYLKASLDFENTYENTQRLARIDFKDTSGTRRFIELTASKRQGTINEESFNNVTLSFMNDIPNVLVNNAIASAELRTTLSTNAASAFFVYNDNEIVGVTASYGYTVQDDSSGLTNLVVNLRQGVRDTLPNSATTTLTSHNTLSEGHSVTVSHSEGNVKKLSARIRVNQDMTTYEGHVIQRFDVERYPENVEFAAARTSNGVEVTTTYTKRSQKTITFSISKPSESSLELSLSHNDYDLLAPVPSSIEATLQWGTRSSDNGKGIWLVSTMGGNSPFTAELVYFNDDTFSVSAKLHHQVREFLTEGVWVPQIHGEGSVGGSLSSFDMRWSLQIDSDLKNKFLLNWQSDEAEFLFVHNCDYLRSLNIPQEIGTNLSWSTAGQPIFGFTVRFDGTVTTGSLSETPEVISIRYFSNCSAIAGHFDIEIQRSATQSSVRLSITQNRRVRRAFASYNLDWSGGSISTHMRQNLYENDAMPNIPSEVRMTVSMPTANEFSFSGHYNDYFIQYEGSMGWQEESSKYVLLDSYSDNVWDTTPDFTSHMEITINPFSSISIMDRYTINEHPERMIKASISYAKDSDSETRRFSTLLRHNEPLLTQWGLPENVLSEFSITPQQYGFQSTLQTTINNKVQRISAMTTMDTTQYSLRFGVDHSIAKLEELGVFRHFVVQASASPAVNDQMKSITANGAVEVNDNNYRVDISGSMVSHPEQSQVEINTELNHNIMELYSLGIPIRTLAITNIGYSVLGGELSGESSTSSTIFRTMINEETGERYEVENHINLSINMQLFSWNVIFAGSHDFEITFLPNKVRYEIAASGSIGSSHVFHKSLVMSLTLDDKTEVASTTINSNPTDNSFTLAFSHNATRIYKYGIPGTMAITFRKRSLLDFDLGVVYDTSKKSVGFKFDYHGERNHLDILFNHNFDLVVEKVGLPKRIGIEIGAPYSDHDAELEIRYIWGKMIKIGHATFGWNLGEAPSVTYNHHHNITTDEVFPRSLRMAFTSSYDNQFNVRIVNGRKRMTIRYDSDKYGRTLYTGSVTINQNMDVKRLPRYSRYDVSLSDSNVLDLSVTFNREVKLHTTVIGNLNLESMSASVTVENTQQFIDNDKFPNNLNFYANGSISSGITTYVRLARGGQPTFTFGFKTGVNMEGQSGYVELIHSQKNWKKIIPKRMRADAVYSAVGGNQRSLTINVRQGKQRNEIILGSGYSVTDNAVYGRLSYTHDFDEYREQIPMSGNLNLLLEKTVQSIYAQANVSLDELFLTHSLKAIYIREDNAMSTSFEVLQDNIYLGSYNVHTISGSVFSEWEDDILARIKSQYGDKTTDLQFATDQTTRAELTFSHTWSLSPRDVHIVLSRSSDDTSATLSVAIDEIERRIQFSGNLNENQGELHFTHQFAESLIPNDIIIRGSYRITPDYHLAVHAIVDGQERSISVGYSKLEDGFHITSSLLDDVTRSATVRQNMILGGFSVDIDHDIPELLSYIPGSFGVAASIQSSPRPNVTLSIRQEQKTKSLTSQVDFNSLQFKLKHDFDFLPFPRSTSVGLSGSTNPFQGSITLAIDQTERTISGTADPENMLISILHSIPELPLPNKMQISLSGSSSPLSCGISVSIDGLDRTARASFDRANMRGRLQHTIPELDRLFSARDIVFQSKGSLEPISGELFVSVDGLERRVNGMFNRRERYASFHQNILESRLIPRNITLSVKGSMQPLSGSIHLTVDDIERSIGTELNLNKPFASLTHNIPEAEPYIPKHMSVSTSFTDSSGSASIEFTRNGRNQHATLGITTNRNHIRAQLTHTVDTTYDIPGDIVVDISGSVDHKNATVYVRVDQSFVSVGGQILLGNEKWYGGSMESQHNIKAVHFIPPNFALMAKARKFGKTYETVLNINGLENYDYSGAASLRPTIKAKRKILEAFYEHIYNGRSRSMSASISGSKKKGIYKLILDGSQTVPSQREFHLISSVQPDVDEHYQVTFAISVSHNIPEFVEYGIPRSIRNGQVVLKVYPDRNVVSGKANALVDNQRTTYSFEWRSQISSQIFSCAFNLSLQDGTRNEAYLGELSIHLQDDLFSFSRILTITDRNSEELLRDDNILVTISLDSRNPTARLHVQQKEVNELGFPVDSEISFSRSENQAISAYELIGSFDDLPIHFKFNHKLQFHPFRLYLLASANQSLPILVKYGVPTHLLSELNVTSDLGRNTNSRIVLEYNNDEVIFTGAVLGAGPEGSVDYVFEHNIPAWRQSLGYNKIEEKYVYTLNQNILQVTGTVVVDDKKTIGIYHSTFNTQTYEIEYVARYNNRGYSVNYNYNISKPVKMVTLSILYNENTLFLWHYHYAENNLVSHFVNHLYGTEFDISYNASVTSAGYNARFNSEISTEEGESTVKWISEPYSEASLTGQKITFNYAMGSKTLSSGLTVARNAPSTEGKFVFSITNKNSISHFPKKVQATANYNQEGVHVVLVYGRKRLSIDFTFGKTHDMILSEMSFSYKRIDFLQDMNVPEEISSSFSYTPSAASGTVRAGKQDIVRFEADPTTFDMKIRNLQQEILLSISGTYSTTPLQSVDSTVICQPFGIDLHFTGTLKMFESGTGNSTLVMSLVDNNNPQRIDFNGFASPTSVEARDFLVGVNIKSSIPMLPFNILMKYNSTWDANENTYIGDFGSWFDDSEFSLGGAYGPNKSSFTLVQPWFTSYPVVTIKCSRATDSEGYTMRDMKLQWNTDQDSLGVTLKYKNAGINIFNSIHVTQPSSIFGVYDYMGNVFLRYTPSDTLNFGINSNTNFVGRGLNVSYTGVLPQAFGSHYLRVDIKQITFPFFPSQFTTIGNISIGSTGTYRSDWRMTSQEKEIVVLRKSLIPSENGASFDLLWKQALIPNIPFSYLSLQGLFQNTDIEKSGKSSLQIDSHPVMSGQFGIRSTEDNDRVNTSISMDVVSGPLSHWLKFRTASMSTWFKSEFDDRQTAPAFSSTLVIDQKAYQIASSSHSIFTKKSARLQGTVSISHPLDLFFYGIPLPRESHYSLAVLLRNKGSRIDITYNNDRMEYPFSVTTHYRVNNRDVPFEITTNVKYGPEEANDDITTRLNIATNDNGLSKVMTISMQYPERGINGELVIGGVNSATNLGFEAVAKDYSVEEVKTWEIRLFFQKPTNIIELHLDSPNMNPVDLQGDLTQVIIQARQLVQRMLSEATSTQLRMIRGYEPTGHDMYIGYEVVGDATYTLHMIFESTNTEYNIIVQTEKNFQFDKEVARATIRLANEQLIQLQLSANPAVVNFLQKAISEYDKEVSRKVNWFADNLIDFLQSLKTIVTGNESAGTSTNQQVDIVIAKVNALRDMSLRLLTAYTVTTSDNLDQAGSALENLVRDTITSLLNQIDSLKASLLRPFTDLRDEYFEAALRRINLDMERILQPVVAQLRKVNAGELFIELVEDAVQNTVKFVMSNGEASLIAARKPLSELLVVTETEVIFNIPLQFKVDHFTPMPTFSDVKKWVAQSALAIKIDDAANVMYSFTNCYYRAQALVYMPRDEILPPFKGHSFVSGFRHFSTFDKKHFGFSSGCATSHILASDLRDGNFTVSVSYADPSHRRSLNSIEVIVGNRHVVISNDYKVTTNGRNKQLPLDLNLLSVTLEGNVIHVRRPEGDVDVACDFTKELCTVDVSPYYFGATAGLAGVYNNEPMDDFKTPSHTIVDTAAQLASSWEVSGSHCSSANTYRPCDSNMVSEVCSAIFDDSKSPMRSCFPLVDPKDFMNICRDDMCDSDDTTKKCAAVHAYAYRCNLLGAAVSIPEECVICSDSRGNPFDATQPQTSRISGLDVVFVIEQGSCKSRSFSSAMRKFSKQLVRQFSDQGLKKNRFHVVGYGGPGAHAMPHTLTVKGRRFSEKKNEFVKALKRLPLSTVRIHADAIGAISYATQLPFRAGVKPMIVLLPCDPCHTESKTLYGNVELQLRQQGIVFHHIAPHRITPKTSLRQIYGFDGTNAFSRGNAVGSISSIRQNKEDLCVPLATETGGSVWDARLLSHSDFTSKLTRYIANGVDPAIAQTCKCAMNSAGAATSICSPTS